MDASPEAGIHPEEPTMRPLSLATLYALALLALIFAYGSIPT